MLREFVRDSSPRTCFGKLMFDNVADEVGVDGCVDERDLADESNHLS
jgi:hypothetical protein